MLPGPLAEASGLVSGTIVGDTNTEIDGGASSEVFAANTAVPSSLMVLRRILAYSKSTAAILEMPAVGTVLTGMVFPYASLAADTKRQRAIRRMSQK